jgi:hypothetical protein
MPDTIAVHGGWLDGETVEDDGREDLVSANAGRVYFYERGFRDGRDVFLLVKVLPIGPERRTQCRERH